MLTKKQQQILILFAQNYSLYTIAKETNCRLKTVNDRLYKLSKKHKKEFENALSIRHAYQKDRLAIKNTKCFSEFDNGIDFLDDIPSK